MKLKKTIAAALASMLLLSACGSTLADTPENSASVTETVSEESVNQTQESTSTQQEPAPKEEAPVLEPVDLTFGSGNYTAGIDFPAGKYDLIAVSGGGNVSSDNMYDGGINAIMGVASDPAFADMYEKEYQNIKLPEGTILSISGVQIQMLCDKPEGGVAPREQPNTETIEVGNGNFVAGEDFPAGIYNIVAVSGGGNVSSDNMYDGGINAIMGVASDPTFADMYEKEYKNIVLSEGTTLSVDGVQLQLVPSK